MRSGIDLTHVDDDIRIQDDLFGHLNGTWWWTAEIPADRASDGAFYALADKAEADVRTLVEEAATTGGPTDTGPGRIGALYRSFMDTERIQALGATPLAEELDAVDAVQDADSLLEVMGWLQARGVPGLWNWHVDTDPGNPDRYVFNVLQGGLGLPDESYYHQPDFASILADYTPAVERLLRLSGIEDPAGTASGAVAVEKALAAGHWDQVESRDAIKTYNLLDAAALQSTAPGLDLARWTSALGASADGVTEVVLHQPSAFTHVAAVVANESIEDWRSWLRWRVVHARAPYLSQEIADASFDFFDARLTGAQQIRERWKRGVEFVEACVPEDLGQLYVKRHFPPEAKDRMQRLVDNLISAYRAAIENLEWMSPQTRTKALEKLAEFTPKIGYPDKWKSYDDLIVEQQDVVGNAARANQLEVARQLTKLGAPVDRTEWFMPPQTVNAYYNPGMNEIVFPAAILQPPFFDVDADDAVNYGAIGAVIGHEIGHGFDDQGSRFDGRGRLRDWWTETDRDQFDALGHKLVTQYDGMSSRDLPDRTVNGALTLGENIGDLGGIGIAHQAYRLSLQDDEPPVLAGFTGDQRVFLGWAQAWRGKQRPEEAARRLAIDPHAPMDLRCNIVRNLNEFHTAFDVAPGDGMWLDSADRIRIW